MEENMFPTNREEIEGICHKYRIKNYIINPDGTIDVEGNVNLVNINLDKLPIRFNKISDSFYCQYNKLTTLEGSPKEVGDNFVCDHNQLTTLKGGPKKVGDGFYCYNNKLTTLEGCPEEVNYSFNCSNNMLTSLKGAPKKIVRSHFNCSDNKLTTLEGAPKKVEYFHCCGNPLVSLEGVPISKGYNLADTPFAWTFEKLRGMLLWGFNFGLTPDECLCISKKNPDRERMMNNLRTGRKGFVGVLSIIYELEKMNKDGKE